MNRLVEFLKGDAFRPHPLDITAPLRTRLAGRRFVFAQRLQNRWELKLLECAPDGEGLSEHEELKIPLSEGGDRISKIRHFAREHEVEYAVVSTSLQMKFMERSLEELPHSSAETQATLVEDPRSILEAAYQEDFRYFPIPNPFVDATYLFHMPIRTVDDVASELRQAGLSVCRVQSTIACGLKYLFDKRSDILRIDGCYLLMFDDEAYLGCSIKDASLVQPTWRSSEKFGSIGTVLQTLRGDFASQQPKSLVVGNHSSNIDLIAEIRNSGVAEEEFEILDLYEEISEPDQEVILYG